MKLSKLTQCSERLEHSLADHGISRKLSVREDLIERRTLTIDDPQDRNKTAAEARTPTGETSNIDTEDGSDLGVTYPSELLTFRQANR
jgi:hypothetical protein